MGCSESKDNSALDSLRSQYPKTLSILELQQYSKELAALFIDANLNDVVGQLPSLSLNEFLMLCKIPKNRVSQRLFCIADMDGTGTLDFRETCYALWQLCTLDHEGLQSMLFEVYDEFNNGSIEFDDVERMFLDSYGQVSGEEIDNMISYVKEKGVLNRVEFNHFCDRCPQTMKQLVDVQSTMRKNVLGVKVWKALEERRKRKTDPYFRPENWSLLMERIILMDMEAREAIEKREEEMALKKGKVLRKKIRHHGTSNQEQKIRYEP